MPSFKQTAMLNALTNTLLWVILCFPQFLAGYSASSAWLGFNIL